MSNFVQLRDTLYSDKFKFGITSNEVAFLDVYASRKIKMSSGRLAQDLDFNYSSSFSYQVLQRIKMSVKEPRRIKSMGSGPGKFKKVYNYIGKLLNHLPLL
ncbi:MAG: hypothetical protein NZ954_08010 [Thermofilaceae archaeon]|nr:hypothetical protein [Thermofilaceae archaeon]MDW8003622.1 hypothetical protein [Thermofilaceae archaeon]